MRNFVIIGLGQLGKCMLQSLSKRRVEVLVIDKQDEKVELARDLATATVKADALNFEVLRELFPESVHCAIVDLGRHQLERSILVTNYLHKMGVPNIVVHAITEAHAEILKIVGATRVVFPEEEAAERLVGIFSGQGAVDFFPVSETFSMIENPIPDSWVGKSLRELEVRRRHGVNVVALRTQTPTNQAERWQFPEPEYRFTKDDLVLLVGEPKRLQRIK